MQRFMLSISIRYKLQYSQSFLLMAGEKAFRATNNFQPRVACVGTAILAGLLPVLLALVALGLLGLRRFLQGAQGEA